VEPVHLFLFHFMQKMQGIDGVDIIDGKERSDEKAQL
jgi:hypothetical protein